MLTRKHYKLIAKAIYEAGNSKQAIIDSLSIALYQDNHNFKPGRFEEACLTGKGVV